MVAEHTAASSRELPGGITENDVVACFDGVCNFCNSTTQFALKRDPCARIKFAALQSKTGEAIREWCGIPAGEMDTMILVDHGRGYTKSSAALRLVRNLRWPWPLLYGFIVVPRFIRDAIYGLLARNRYRWFGKQAHCLVPSPETRQRFLD